MINAELIKRKTLADAPACLNVNDKAMWLTGWNEAAAALEAVPEGWRPIETAPRNKTFVALLRSDGSYARYGVGWYMPMDGWRGWQDDAGQPTHWMPLPAAPKKEPHDHP